jgi:CRISPR-associated protein Cas2
MAPLIVVSYDIPDDRRRLRLAHALKDFGIRVQYSVFECHLESTGLETLRKRLGQLIDPTEDRVRLYRFCEDCGTKLEIYGQGKSTEEPETYIL